MFSNQNNQKKGIYFALITAVISGISIFLNKFAISFVNPPVYFTSIKNLIVGFFILGIVLYSEKWGSVKKLKRKQFIKLILISIVGGSIPFYLYFTGLSMVSSINGAMIHKTLIIWVAILAVPFLKEKLSKTQALAVFLLFVSNFVVGGFKGFQFSRGEMLVLSATILWAVENVLSKKILSSVDPDVVILFRMGLGSLFLMSFAVSSVPDTLSKTLALSVPQLFWILLTAILLLGYVLTWYRALKFAPAVLVTSVLVSSTLITNILSAIFITHSWNAVLTFQTLFIITGISLFWSTEKKRPVQVQVSVN